jgi:putative oxidoreductase
MIKSKNMKTKKSFKELIISTVYDNKAIIVRLAVGLIFLSEGMQKYMFPELVGTGRFEKIGFADPAFWAYFTGTFEIICGALVLLGLFTRVAAIPLMIIMMTAFVTTKWPILVDKGFWAMAHEYRTDFTLTLLLIYLIIYGGGSWSVDLNLLKHRDR